MRAFIAFKLPQAVTAALSALQSDLRKSGLKPRWVRAGNIHLTLKFLGEVGPGQPEDLSAAIEQVAQRHRALSLKAAGLGVFPTVHKARVIWSGVHGETDRLGALHTDLEHALAGIVRPETRPFRAHLTLGRIKGRMRPEKLVDAIAANGSFASPPFSAGRLILFRSDLRPNGAIYTEIAGADLTVKDGGVCK